MDNIMATKRTNKSKRIRGNHNPLPEHVNWTVLELWQSGKYKAKLEKDRKQEGKRNQQRKAKHKKRLQDTG